ncbi:hypothetical protein [Thiothrix fructosivorans]|uniref:Uncharacterized protein n=1 Tax=Thiothrix fructosivorans TaxID=111770 RepID=A0A8B0SFB8_9GAMM|nr:hypothetical protein [Thiothrix fructosivorans]MBO0615273.1 hypothetical protein [Thiothrix fructosivorans]QTX10056.1 hypothetical protein J1836_015845 [Thiothrix fructosivorans]
MNTYYYGQRKYTLAQLRELRKKMEGTYSSLVAVSKEDFEAKEEIDKMNEIDKKIGEAFSYLHNEVGISYYKVDDLKQKYAALRSNLTFGAESSIY